MNKKNYIKPEIAWEHIAADTAIASTDCIFCFGDSDTNDRVDGKTSSEYKYICGEGMPGEPSCADD